MKTSHRAAQTEQSANHDLVELRSRVVEIIRSVRKSHGSLSSWSCGMTRKELEEKEERMFSLCDKGNIILQVYIKCSVLQPYG